MSAKKLTIYSYPHNPNVATSLIAASLGGVEIEQPEFAFGKDNKTPEFLAKYPIGKVPAADTPDGPLFESRAILRYVARIGTQADQLLGSTDYERSVIDQWVDFNAFYITPNTFPLFAFIYGFPYNAEKFNEAKEGFKKAFGALEGYLKTKYLTGDTFTIADITFACAVFNPLKHALELGLVSFDFSPTEFVAQYLKVHEYIKNLYAHEHVKKVLGELQIIEKFTPPQ